jgi:membrane dipeptidase
MGVTDSASPMLLFDAHLDLALNAVDWNRNLERSVSEMRAAEAGMTDPGRGTNTVSFEELRTAGVRLCVSTLLARREPNVDHSFGWTTYETCNAMAHAHLAWHRAMERRGLLRMIRTKRDLDAHVQTVREGEGPLGFVLSMECGDAVLDPDQIEEWHEAGLRAIGITHYGVNRYGGGTATDVPLHPDAFPLLRNIERLGMALDLTHLSDPAFWQALEAFGGRVIGSHQNSRKWANWQRQWSDEQMKAVIDRDGVIGAACDAIMLQEDWVRGKSRREVTLERVVDNIDHVCQLAGNARHAGIGSDLDGGYGSEQTPADLETIADLRRMPDLLGRRGYPAADVEAIMHGNWIRFFSQSLPD